MGIQNSTCREVCGNKQNEEDKNTIVKSEKADKLVPICFDDWGLDSNERLDRKRKEQSSPSVLHSQTHTEKHEDSAHNSICSENGEEGVREIIVIGNLRTGLDSMISTQKQHQTTVDQLEIPFRVIKLTMNKQLLEEIDYRYPKFLHKHSDPSQAQAKNWRLSRTGAYINLDSNVYGTVVTPTHFYEGFFLLDLDEDSGRKFIPDTRGLYICDKYTYKGEIRKKKAHGEGELVYRNHGSDDIYEGQWEDGLLVAGKIKTASYLYEGELSHGRPHGKGHLTTPSGVLYQGRFQFGYFHDQNASYDCPLYHYRGGFKSGMKEGYGVMYHKQLQRNLEGRWHSNQIQVDEEYAL